MEISVTNNDSFLMHNHQVEIPCLCRTPVISFCASFVHNVHVYQIMYCIKLSSDERFIFNIFIPKTT